MKVNDRMKQLKSYVHSYVDRRKRKRTMRQLWITRINAAVRQYNMNYSKFINACKKANVIVNRQHLANLTVTDKAAFECVLAAI